MISPLQCQWYLELLLAMLAALFVFMVINFILVLSGNSENERYKQFDKFTELFSKCFGLLLLVTIAWLLSTIIYGVIK